ncbi:hypothetical protein NPIL_279431 [Nephila pilipes]|uniref:Uncharacterized protein n=1 Tax=Nephila pilipes TaxID=299642 RepID=A0A8X6T7A6_NEPPI|nr:hypothetical protein NPIL_279431 [Nephila pilipes]
MDFPPPGPKKYNNAVNTLQKFTKEVAEASMQIAALKGVTPTYQILSVEDDIWKNWGYYSCVGVCAAIGNITGKMIDVDILSYFKGCDSCGSDRTVIMEKPT